MFTRRALLGASLLQLTAESSREAVDPAQLPLNRLVFGGDVMLSRSVARTALGRHDAALPFRSLAPYLSAADLAFVNLESPFTDREHMTGGGMVFKTEPDMIEGLLEAGIDVVSTANNHSRDCGAYGIGF